MAWCLPGNLADQLLGKFRSGEVTPDKLTSMTSAERNAYFGKMVGEQNATKMNAAFERKLLLKNQQRGIVTWAKQVTGMKKAAERDILSRVERMTEVLQPEQAENFYADLASQRLGMRVTVEEANTIAKLAKRVTERNATLNENFEFPSKAEQHDYAIDAVAFRNYTRDLKLDATSLSPGQYVVSRLKNPLRFAKDVAANAKATLASWDDSGVLRQGWKMLTQYPIPGAKGIPQMQSTWFKNSLKTFRDIGRELKGVNAQDIADGEIMSRPDYLRGHYKRSEIHFGFEEEFPAQAPTKIPVLGRVFKAAESAFTNFSHKNRADMASLYYRVAETYGHSLTEKPLMRDIGKLASTLSSRAYMGRWEPVSDAINIGLFSPRNLKSNYDVLTGHSLGSKLETSFAKKQAAVNSLRMISGTAAIMTTAHVLMPGSVEWDPRSADFGKVKVGNIRVDVSGGSASMAVLAARMACLMASEPSKQFGGKEIPAMKSTTTGKLSALNTGDYGKSTGLDLVYDFIGNKYSPAFGVTKEMLEGRTFGGDKPTLGSVVTGLTEPMVIGTGRELWGNRKEAQDLLYLIGEGLGSSVMAYPTYSTLAEIEKKGGGISARKSEEWQGLFKKITKDHTFDWEAYKELLK